MVGGDGGGAAFPCDGGDFFVVLGFGGGVGAHVGREVGVEKGSVVEWWCQR